MPINPAKQVAKFRERYAELKTALAPENTPDTLRELQASNLKLGKAVKKLREDIEKSLTTLPNGERILTGEYVALCELARLNGVKEDEVISGVREVCCGRVARLELYGMGLTDIRPLAGLMALTELWLHRNQISDLRPLSGLTVLTELGLEWNQISDLRPLSGLTALTGLWLERNQISDLSPLSGPTALTGLWLSDNQISDLRPLSGLTALTGLWLHSNQIRDLSPLSGLTALTSLGLICNPLSSGSRKFIAKLKTKGVNVVL